MDDKLIISNNYFIHGEKKYVLDDFFTSEFYSWINDYAGTFEGGHPFDNMTYLMVFQKIMAIKYYFLSNNIREVVILPDAQHEIASFAFDAALQLELLIDATDLKLRKCIKLKSFILLYVEFSYLLMQQLVMKYINREIDYRKNLCVVRTPAAKEKMRNIDNVIVFSEDKVAKGDLYSFFKKRVRVAKLFQAIRKAKRLLQDYEVYLKKNKCVSTKSIAYDFISVRLLPVCYYEAILDELQKLPWEGSFISGNNLDMYAYVEEQVSKNNKMHTVCIPHGLEYGFKFPHCFTGDVFYATSDYAAKYLNNLYKTHKFVFNKKVAEKMFSYTATTKSSKEKLVVYFSEPREPEVNIEILRRLKTILNKKGIDLYIKHHPKDKKEDYSVLNNIKEITNLQEAITENVCIARKSTTLLEATYNRSKCAAILINEKDKAIFKTFPSLSSDSICCFYSIDDLAEWVEREVKG